ncbi:MAG: hypothetical protein WKG00_13760 [Polyangiaceae bacterium]
MRAWRARVADDPGDLEALDGLVKVLRAEQRWRDLVEALELRAAEHGPQHTERGRADRVEVARLHERELGNRADAIAAWQRVRDGYGPDDESFEALSQLLSAEARWAELAALLSGQAATSDPARRLTLLCRLGDLSRGELGAPAAAAIAYGDALAIDARDRDARAGLRALLEGGVVREAAVDALARSYVETGDWEEAAEMTAALRPGEDVPATLARKLWWGVALYFRDDKGNPDEAELALRRALLHDDNNPEILASLAAVQRRKPSRPLVDTLVRLSEARGGDLDLLREAADIGIRVLGDRQVGPQNCERLLDLAVSRWAASGKKEGGKKKRLSDVAEDPRSPRAVARWALSELLRMAAEDKDHARMVTLLLRGAELPFDRAETRRMRRDAAVVAARDLADPDEAVRIYRELFDEDASDEVAAAETEAFAALLERRGAIADLAALWERRAATLEETGDARSARELWSRAAVIDEERLHDVDRAMADHGHAATLGSNVSRAALARLHTERGSLAEAAEALDALQADAEPAVIAEASLHLAAALLATGDEAAARARLEATSARLAGDAGQAGTEVRVRLAALYRAGERWNELAALEEASARLAPAPEARLAHLREAASLHLERRNDPGAAVPLLEEAVQLAPEDAVLGLTHIEATAAIGKPADRCAPPPRRSRDIAVAVRRSAPVALRRGPGRRGPRRRPARARRARRGREDRSRPRGRALRHGPAGLGGRRPRPRRARVPGAVAAEPAAGGGRRAARPRRAAAALPPPRRGARGSAEPRRAAARAGASRAAATMRCARRSTCSRRARPPATTRACWPSSAPRPRAEPSRPQPARVPVAPSLHDSAMGVPFRATSTCRAPSPARPALPSTDAVHPRQRARPRRHHPGHRLRKRRRGRRWRAGEQRVRRRRRRSRVAAHKVAARRAAAARAAAPAARARARAVAAVRAASPTPARTSTPASTSSTRSPSRRTRPTPPPTSASATSAPSSTRRSSLGASWSSTCTAPATPAPAARRRTASCSPGWATTSSRPATSATTASATAATTSRAAAWRPSRASITTRSSPSPRPTAPRRAWPRR